MYEVTKEMAKHGVRIRRGNLIVYKDQKSRFKAAPPLTSKDSTAVLRAFQTIYECLLLRWPNILQVDPGHEFMGEVAREAAKHGVRIKRGNVNIHRYQGITEQLNQTLGECLFHFPIQSRYEFHIWKEINQLVKRVPEVNSFTFE